jgi:uncharacterized membrane protein
LVALALVLAAIGASLTLYSAMPAKIPTHWNIRGQVDGYGDKSWALFMLPGAMAGMMLLFALLPTISPKPFQVTTFRSTYLYIMVLVVALFGYIHLLTLMAATGRHIDFPRVMIGGMYLFFIALGNVLGKVRRNFYIGVRVPWTIANDRVWNDTHRLAAWLCVIGGLIGFAINLVGYPMVSLIPVGVALVVPIVYSYFRYRELDRQGAL